MNPTKFHTALKQAKQDVIEMGRLAESMLKDGVIALKKQDLQLAEEVDNRKTKLAAMDDSIEQELLQLLTLYQPMGKDVRELAASLKLITYIYRVGRYGKDIAKITLEIGDKPHLAKLVSIPHMAEIACEMIEAVLAAYTNKDLSNIGVEEFTEKDDDVDAMYESIIREAMTYAMEDPSNISRCIRYIMVGRSLERASDNICKMAEKIHYMIDGKRHEIK